MLSSSLYLCYSLLVELCVTAGEMSEYLVDILTFENCFRIKVSVFLYTTCYP